MRNYRGCIVPESVGEAFLTSVSENLHWRMSHLNIALGSSTKYM
jgi:hypothetical protein